MEAAKIKSVECETFWKEHYDILKSSGIKRTEYCRQNHLNYDRFGYWISRLNQIKNKSSELIPIKLKSNELSNEKKTLCTLILHNDSSLEIHESSALTLILERYC